jgi:hypothetical protein
MAGIIGGDTRMHHRGRRCRSVAGKTRKKPVIPEMTKFLTLPGWLRTTSLPVDSKVFHQ